MEECGADECRAEGYGAEGYGAKGYGAEGYGVVDGAEAERSGVETERRREAPARGPLVAFYFQFFKFQQYEKREWFLLHF